MAAPRGLPRVSSCPAGGTVGMRPSRGGRVGPRGAKAPEGSSFQRCFVPNSKGSSTSPPPIPPTMRHRPTAGGTDRNRPKLRKTPLHENRRETYPKAALFSPLGGSRNRVQSQFHPESGAASLAAKTIWRSYTARTRSRHQHSDSGSGAAIR